MKVLVWLLLVAAAVALALTPMLLITPTSAQDAFDLAVAYEIQRIDAWLGGALWIAAAWLAWRIWQGGARVWLRAVLVLGLFATSGAWLFAAVILHERMFEPLTEVGHVAAADARHIEPDDLVLGVAIGGQAVAYPVDIVGYHHIVNDRLAGEPFVVTY